MMRAGASVVGAGGAMLALRLGIAVWVGARLGIAVLIVPPTGPLPPHPAARDPITRAIAATASPCLSRIIPRGNTPSTTTNEPSQPPVTPPRLAPWLVRHRPAPWRRRAGAFPDRYWSMWEPIDPPPPARCSAGLQCAAWAAASLRHGVLGSDQLGRHAINEVVLVNVAQAHALKFPGQFHIECVLAWTGMIPALVNLLPASSRSTAFEIAMIRPFSSWTTVAFITLLLSVCQASWMLLAAVRNLLPRRNTRRCCCCSS